MATKKSRLVIAFILMLTMVSFFSLPASVFADPTVEEPILETLVLETTPPTIQLNVEYGGIAIIDGTKYTPGGPYDISEHSGDSIKAYSNAGYAANLANTYTIGASDESITVKFMGMTKVYDIPYYVIDGYFSGYNPDGSDITEGHDPKGDVLAATMTASPTTSVYALGTTANILLNVSVSKGDDASGVDTKQLNEVDFYENGLGKQTFENSAVSNPVTFSTIIPTSESALVAAGFVLTNTATHRVYTKSLIYDLVDRYDGVDAASIIATATSELVVKIEKPINLWVASDDYADVYINDAPTAIPVTGWGPVTKLSVEVADNPFIAAKAKDLYNVIAGFKLVFKNSTGTYLTTNSRWYYYFGSGDTTIPPAFNGKNWYEEDYQATVGWYPVSIMPFHENWTTEFPATANWIWSHNFIGGEKVIDTPVYLRSMPPTPIPTKGTINVYKNVIGSDGTDVTDTTPFNFSYQSVSSEIGTNNVVGGTVIEGEATPIELDFGTYRFTELATNDKYTDITTAGSVTVTISEGALTANVLFVNQLKASTPVDPVDPVRPTPRRTITVSEEPTPAGPIVTPEVLLPVIEDATPGAPVELPKTGGLDPSFLYGLGAMLATGGLVIRRKKK